MANTVAPASIHQNRTRDVEFHVTYLDTDSGRIRREDFDDLAAAERFASAQLRDEDGWAVVDHVKIEITSRMVA